MLLKCLFTSTKMPICEDVQDGKKDTIKREWKSIWHNINVIHMQIQIHCTKASSHEHWTLKMVWMHWDTRGYGWICISIVYDLKMALQSWMDSMMSCLRDESLYIESHLHTCSMNTLRELWLAYSGQSLYFSLCFSFTILNFSSYFHRRNEIL